MGVMKKRAKVFVLLGLLAAAPLGATEFSLLNQNARAAGLGGAFVAKADSLFTLYDNPAGLAFLRGLRFEAGYLINNRTVDASAPASGRRFRSVSFQFWGSAALSWQPWPWATLGIGFFTPYNAKFGWPWTWPGESLSIDMEFDAHYLRPAIAVRLPGNLAVGVGLDLVFSEIVWSHEMTLTLPKFPNLGTGKYESRYDMNGQGAGFTAGLLWKPHRMLQVGARYQHRATVDYRGFNVFDSRVEAGGLVPHPEFGTYYYYQFFQFFFKRQEVTARLTMPQDAVGGLLIRPFPNLSLTFDAQKTFWRQMGAWDFKSVNPAEALNPEFKPSYWDFYGAGPDYGEQTAGVVLKDAWKYKGGVEYDLFGRFALRGGFARHESAVEAPDLNAAYPDFGRTIMSLGFGYQGPFFSIWDRKQMGEIAVDLFFQYAWAKKRASLPPGVELTFAGNRWLLGINLEFIL